MEHRTQGTSEQYLVAGDGARFRVTRIDPGTGTLLAPIVYLPGMFSTRAFWCSDRGVGLAAYLAEAGFPGLIVERREADCGARPGLEEHLTWDLPLVQRHVETLWQRPGFWMGHSFGGVLAARAVAEVLDAERVAGLVLFAAQFEVGKRPLHPPFSWATLAMTRWLGYFPARRAGLGPKDEPPAAMEDAVAMVTRGRRDPRLKDALGGICTRTLAVSGTGDKVDPTAGCRRFVAHFGSRDRRFVEAGVAHGFSRDYDHAGIVASRAAAEEIWPLVRGWLESRQGSH